MPLYAYDGKKIIYATDAIKNGSYHCIECKSALKVRRGKDRIPHFYHLQTTPSCRLYSKSEDHLLIQLQIQNLFSTKEIQMETPFLPIHRIADLAWEKEKIVFEIQCSSILPKEVEARVRDYRKIGYEIAWLLDDRLFNRRTIRPAEFFLRSYCCYFFHFQRNGFSIFYDQFEIISEKKRIRISKKFFIDLKSPYKTPKIEWPSYLPKQISSRFPNCPRYFSGDLIHKALQSAESPFITLSLTNWKALELNAAQSTKKNNPISFFFKKYIAKPYMGWLQRTLEKLP